MAGLYVCMTGNLKNFAEAVASKTWKTRKDKVDGWQPPIAAGWPPCRITCPLISPQRPSSPPHAPPTAQDGKDKAFVIAHDEFLSNPKNRFHLLVSDPQTATLQQAEGAGKLKRTKRWSETTTTASSR